MKISQLLSRRPALLRQARLANLAFAHARLTEFGARLRRARLSGVVSLRHSAPEADRFWATLNVQGTPPSVIEEHFTEEDITELADVFSYLTGEPAPDLRFHVGELAQKFIEPLRRELVQHGITVTPESARPAASDGDDEARGYTRIDEGA